MKEFFRITSSGAIQLSDFPVKTKIKGRSESEYKDRLDKNRDRLQEFQTLLYAEQARAVLVIFQGMDTSGKDGAIKHVMSGINPQGCRVVSFKAPSPNELRHDFLWRINEHLPGRGMIGIFNRSYYEDVLVSRVHPKLLLQSKVPQAEKPTDKFWSHRFQDILNYEKYLHHQGYEIIKIFLHISKDEQKARLLDRFNDPKKQWKISEGDIEERKFWKEYQKAYGQCLSQTATKKTPWYIVPADDKESARLSVSEILLERFEKLDLKYPKLSPKEKLALEEMKSSLNA